MEDWVNFSTNLFTNYVESFSNLTAEQSINFEIKKEHSIRVAEISRSLATALKLNETEYKIAFITALFHDIGRFNQLLEFNTFDDSKSVNHAEYSLKVLKENDFLKKLDCDEEDLIFNAIENHNKLEISKKLSDAEMLQTKLLRDADKLDILKVLSNYYSSRNNKPNHTLTWELPKGTGISSSVLKDIMTGKLVSKKDVASEMDVKIMQLSWVYDINFKPSYEILLRNRYLEKIYNSLPKNDQIIEIYRKVKVFAENRLFG